MKRNVSRILSLLLTLSLCAGMLMVPVWAAEEDTSAPDTTVTQPTEGDDAGEPTEGDDAGEPAEGDDAGEPAEGDNADEPTEGEDADEPTEGEDADEPTEGDDADEPAEGEDADEPAEPEKVTFTDVEEGRWYYSAVTTIAAAGWMNGMGEGTFAPTGTFSVAQVLSVAARIHAAANEKEIAAAEEGTPWYTMYVNYCVENEIIAEDAFTAEDLTRAATRFEVLAILDKAPAASCFEAKREVADGYIPDLAEADENGAVVYKWYRAGIIDGNAEHEFTGANTITRAEAASILCRVMDLVDRIAE